jgi:PAS domain S-box-containing protein
MRDDSPLDPAPPLPNARILLVDDKPANLLALEAILGDLGQDLVRATSGEQALKHVERQDFAAILLDVQMPTLNGFETAKLIRNRKRSRHTPIVFLTAYESPDFRVEDAYALGAVDYLVKPLVSVIVRAKVAGFVELYQKAEQIRRQGEQLRELQQREFERRLAEESLRRSEAHFRHMADSAPVLLWVSGADGLCNFFNKPWLEFTGQTLEHELGDGWTRGVHRDDLASCMGTYRDALAGRRSFRIEYRLHRFDGDYRWVLDSGVPRFSADGTFTGFIGSAIDITDRREAEEQLRRSQHQLTDFVENATVGLHWVGPDGTILWANKAELDMLGYTSEEYVGHDIRAFHVDREAIGAVIARLAEGEQLDGYESQMRCKDGSVRHVLVSSSAFREDGKFLHTRCFTRDITDRKLLEEELRQRVEKLAEADRRKDEFLAMLAHELRNPLAPVLNGLQVLRLAESDHELLEQARAMMERQIRHMTRLVDDLLDVSRITRGKVQVRRERLDLAALVRTAAEDRRPTLEQAGLELRVDAPRQPMWVAGDPTRLAQILNNLLDNAVKFRDGGDRVAVTLAEDAAAGRAVLTVRDNGLGIDPEIFPRLFDAFAQADRSLDRSRGGLGLGLSLVKGLAELHGGSVEARSDGPGRGAEFTVRLPLAREAPALTEMPTAPPAVAEPLRILIVEDNRDAANSLCLLLELLGHRARVAYTGTEGVRAAHEWRPDVVLCDIGLPEMDGYDVASELRRSPETRAARLIAVTGYGQEEDRRRAQQAGFDHHLVKPVDPEALWPLLVRTA